MQFTGRTCLLLAGPLLLAGCAATSGPRAEHGTSVSARGDDQSDHAGPETQRARSERDRVTILLDIDETLSVTDYEKLALGIGVRDDSYLHEGAKAVLTELARDFDVVYLTSRPQWLAGPTRQWLVEQGLPDGIMLTSSRLSDVIWPGPFKTRAIATLRATIPLLLIGIGDRGSDAAAYSVNQMMVLIVHPGPLESFDASVREFESWSEIGAFFRTHRESLIDPDRLMAEFGAGGPSPHPQSISQWPPLSLALPLQLLLAGPGMTIESLVKLELGIEQAEAARAIEASRVSLADAMQELERSMPARTLLRIQLGMRDARPTYVANMLDGDQMREVLLDASSGQIRNDAPGPALRWDARDARKAHAQAGLSFAQAFRIASDELKGDYCEAELEIDDRRAAYEFAVLALGRFMELEIDAISGEINEVEDETVGAGR